MRIRALTVTIVAGLLAMACGCGLRARINEQAAIDRYVRGKLLAEQGDMDAALAELAKAVKANPNLSIAHAAAGDIYRKRGDWQSARRSYENACKANPYAFRPHYNLALTYQTLADAAKAVQRVRQMLRLAVQVYLRASILEPDDFETNLNLSGCYFRLGKYDLAESHCKAAIAIKPDDPNARSNLGIIYDTQDMFYEAISAYKASLEIDTNQPKVLMNLGAIYIRQGRLRAAIATTKLAAEQSPDDPAPWEQIGKCHYYLKEYAQAVEAYQKAVSLGKASAAAHRGIGVVYMTQFVLNGGDDADLRDKGLAAWHASLEIQPDQKDLRELVRKYSPAYDGPKL